MADLDGTPPRRVARRGYAERLNAALLSLAAHHAQVLEHFEQPWASVTYSGTRHRVTLWFNGAEAVAAGEEFITCLADHEFTIPGRLVADAEIGEVHHRMHPCPSLEVHCEVLLLEDS